MQEAKKPKSGGGGGGGGGNRDTRYYMAKRRVLLTGLVLVSTTHTCNHSDTSVGGATCSSSIVDSVSKRLPPDSFSCIACRGIGVLRRALAIVRALPLPPPLLPLLPLLLSSPATPVSGQIRSDNEAEERSLSGDDEGEDKPNSCEDVGDCDRDRDRRRRRRRRAVL